MVLDHADILAELNLSSLDRQAPLPGLADGDSVEDEEDGDLLSYIGQEPVHINDVVRGAGLPVSAVSGALAVQELQGVVKQVGAMQYIRVREARQGL